ncbi:hypothetical protein [Isoptericola chiayiensis]|nr:hypothetical protein [Isoptericola chiayiensis]NOW01086.1 hypothetical protein [Isoptericola chiayiensis]
MSYDIPGAAAATGLSESLIRHHIRNGDIAVRYAGAKEHEARG